MTKSLFTPETESYIVHEVKIRLHEERFKEVDRKFDAIDAKLNWILTIIVGVIVIPASLHILKLL